MCIRSAPQVQQNGHLMKQEPLINWDFQSEDRELTFTSVLPMLCKNAIYTVSFLTFSVVTSASRDLVGSNRSAISSNSVTSSAS
jgi:hypothetical protein